MARQKLTANRIRKFQCPQEKQQAFLWDSEVPGLGVRATKSGKVYVFQGRLAEKTIRVKIGDVRARAIDSTEPGKPPGARQEARLLQGLIDKEIDPRLEKKEQTAATKRKQIEAERKEQTIGEIWGIYLADRRDKWSERHLFDHIDLSKQGGGDVKKGKGKIKPGPLASLMRLKASELTPAKVEAWAKNEASVRATRTRLAFSLLRTFINWCNEQPAYKGLIPAEVCSTRTKREIIPKARAKDDCLQREQLNAWFAAVRGLHNPTISAYLQTLLLTGARRNELASLKWQDIDFQWNALTIHDKVDGTRTIPLTPYIGTILNALPRRNEFVFSSPTSRVGRLVEPRIYHNKALVKAGIEGLTLHGLRRSFGTLSEWVEVPAGIAAQLMGHKPSATAEKHYRRRPLDLLRKWHEKIEAWILEQAGIEQPKEIKQSLHLVEQEA